MTRGGINRFAARRRDVLYGSLGEAVQVDGQACTGVLSPPRVGFGVVAGGVEVEIRAVLRLRMSDVDLEPERYAPVVLGDGRRLVVGQVRGDAVAGEWVLDLIEPGGSA